MTRIIQRSDRNVQQFDGFHRTAMHRIYTNFRLSVSRGILWTLYASKSQLPQFDIRRRCLFHCPCLSAHNNFDVHCSQVTPSLFRHISLLSPSYITSPRSVLYILSSLRSPAPQPHSTAVQLRSQSSAFASAQTSFTIPSNSTTISSTMSSRHSPSHQSTAQRQPSSSRLMPSIAVMGTGTPARNGHFASRYGEYLEVPSSHRPSTTGSHHSSASGSHPASASGQRSGMLGVPHGQSSSGTRSGSASHHSSSRSNGAGAGMLQVPQAQSGRSSSASRSASAFHHPFGDLRDPASSSSYYPSRTADHCSPSSAGAMVLRPQIPSRTASSSTRVASRPSSTTHQVMVYEHTSVQYYTEHSN
jgi:hypothetical protein